MMKNDVMNDVMNGVMNFLYKGVDDGFTKCRIFCVSTDKKMSFALHTADLSNFLNKTAKSYDGDVVNVVDWQKRGVFSSIDRLKDLFTIKQIINESKVGPRVQGTLKDSSMSSAIGLIHRVFKNAGPEFCQLSEEEFENVRNMLSTESLRLKKKANEAREAGEKPVDKNGDIQWIDDWKAEIDKMKEYFEKNLEPIYDKPMPSKHEVQLLQDGVIGIFVCFFYNVRGNFGTLKNYNHKDVDWKKDNIFIFDRSGNASIFWNDRKFDRISASKKRKRDDDINLSHQFHQHMVTSKFDKIEDIDPEYVAKVLVRFIKRFRSDSEYIFLDSKGKPFSIDTFRDHIQDVFSKSSKKRYGVLLARQVQITHIRKSNLSRAASLYVAEQCHHNESENLKYCRDKD